MMGLQPCSPLDGITKGEAVWVIAHRSSCMVEVMDSIVAPFTTYS